MKSRPKTPLPPTPAGTGNRRIYVQAAVLSVVTIVIYLPALSGGFVWDDQLLVTRNPLLGNFSGLGEIWLFGRTADYFPLTNTVFWIEWHVFGQSPAGYHLVNLFLHMANAFLLWRVLLWLDIPAAWLAALIFAVHPVHVESVAWISELKNVLSMFWALVSVLLFLRFVDRRAGWKSLSYFGSLTAFVLALLAKTQVVFLPAALLLCIWWRAHRGQRRNNIESRAAVIAIWPFFLSALILGLVTVAFQNRGLGEEEVILGGPLRRIVNAATAVWWYAGKLIAPIRLMPIYPAWRFDSPRLTEWIPVIALIAVFPVLWRWRRRGTFGALVAGIGFLISLAPIIGFVQMSYVRSGTLVADHYQYFADVFLIALAGAAIASVWQRCVSTSKVFVGAIAATVVGSMALYSATRSAVYRDEETLWQDNLAKNPNAWQAHNRLGQIYFDRGEFIQAAPHFARAAALKPELGDNHNQLGLVYARLGRFEEAIAEYRQGIRLTEEQRATAQTSRMATMRTNLANALTITANNMSSGEAANRDEVVGRYAEAVRQYQEALKLQPRQPAIHRNLGILLARLGRKSEAIQHLRAALEIVPNEPNAREVLELLERENRDRSQ
ncbi:MAG: tetratricopeptide repeat protein [Chthoniobacterales bacterium]